LAITRARKEELIAQYVDLLDKSNGFVIVQYGGMTVPQIDDLRTKVREAEGQYLVTKNTLFTRALQQQEWPVPDDLLNGPVAVAFGLENLPGVAKAVLDILDKAPYQENLQILGGVMGTDILDPGRVESVSKLPTLDELRAQIAGLVVSPAQGIVNVLYSATGQVVNVLQAYIDDQGEDEAEEEGAA
jgi:large subunit ribosomal protein L10